MISLIEKAVIDRIVDGKHAVLLVGKDEQQYIIPVEQLPQGAQEGSWLEVLLEEGSTQEIRLLMEDTEKIKRRIEDKMSLLRKRGSSLKRKE